jgi:hypothetical protein
LGFVSRIACEPAGQSRLYPGSPCGIGVGR